MQTEPEADSDAMSKGIGKSSITNEQLDAALDSIFDSPSPSRKTSASKRPPVPAATPRSAAAATGGDVDFYASLAAGVSEDENQAAGGRVSRGEEPVEQSEVSGEFGALGGPPPLRPRSANKSARSRRPQRDTSAIDQPKLPAEWEEQPGQGPARAAEEGPQQAGKLAGKRDNVGLASKALGRAAKPKGQPTSRKKTKQVLDDLFADEEEFDLGFGTAAGTTIQHSGGSASLQKDKEESSNFLASMGLGPSGGTTR